MFDYILKKVESAAFLTDPFRHLEIRDLFEPEHFEAIIGDPQVSLPPAHSDKELLELVKSAGYSVIEFPGTASNEKDYLAWRNGKSTRAQVSSVEGVGLVMRLAEPRSTTMSALVDFLNSKALHEALARKFEINLDEISTEMGVQKYFCGYEISPHPDINRKALTFMVNINPAKNSEQINYHTHYLKFEDSRSYVQRYWEGNPKSDRCWVPWEWCKTVKQQVANNSIVIFAPSADTIHAVKAEYDHFETQRTQLYGNFWFNDVETDKKPEWQDFEIKALHRPRKRSMRQIYRDLRRKLGP